MKRSVLIVGGGIIGLAIAREALARGFAVRVIEAGKAGGGTTSAAAGMLCPGFELPHIAAPQQAAFHALAMESLAAWPVLGDQLERETGAHIDLRMDGAIGLAADDRHRARLEALAVLIERFGRPVERLERADIDRLEPQVAPAFARGIFLADEGQVDPRRAAAVLALSVRAQGGDILEGATAAALITEGTRVTGVRREDGREEAADQVVIAAGLAARSLWHETAPAPFFAIKGQAFSLSRKGAAPVRVLRTDNTYICPKAEARIIVGATEEADIETLETDPAHINALRRRAEAVVPVLAGAQLTGSWAGLRPTTPDRLPVIGRSAVLEGLVYAAGHHRNGILMAPVTARLVADSLEGAPDMPLVTPARFGAGG